MRIILFLAALLFATPVIAGELKQDTYLGTSIEEVQKSLTDRGYEIRKTEMEDGKIEVYFVQGNKKGEVYVSTSSGKITKLKMK